MSQDNAGCFCDLFCRRVGAVLDCCPFYTWDSQGATADEVSALGMCRRVLLLAGSSWDDTGCV